MAKPTNRSFRIGVVSTRLFPDRGGPAHYVSGLSLALKALGVESTIIASSANRYSATEKEDREAIKRLPMRAPDPQAGLFTKMMYSLSYALLGTLLGIYWFAKRRVCVVHAHSPSLSSVVGLLLSRVLRVPLVITVHGMLGPRFKWSKDSGSFLSLTLEAILVRSAASVIAVTSDYVPIIEQLAPHTHVCQIGSGVDTSMFSPPQSKEDAILARRELGIDDDTQVLLWVGNFDLEEKLMGVLDSVQAMKDLEGQVQQPHVLLLVGSGMFKPEVETRVAQQGLTDRVRFLGQRDDVPRIMRLSDVFILVSHHEGSPNALLEAMATGLPCIVSRAGDMPRLLADAGLLVVPGDIDNLVSNIGSLLKSPQLRKEMSQRSRNRAVANFSWNRIAEQTMEVYARATGSAIRS